MEIKKQTDKNKEWESSNKYKNLNTVSILSFSGHDEGKGRDGGIQKWKYDIHI